MKDLKKIKVNLLLIAKTYATLSLTLGAIFELLYAFAGNYGAIATLSLAGWCLIALSVPAFVLETIYAKKKH